MTREKLLSEAYHRGLLPPEKKRAYEEGVRRGIIKDGRAAARLKARQSVKGDERLLSAAQGRLLGFVDEGAGAVAAVDAGINNLAARVGLTKPGPSMREAYEGTAQGYRDAEREFASQHPTQNVLLQLVGGATLPGAGFIKGARTMRGAVGRSAAVGGVYGAGAGAGSAQGGVRERLPAAGQGAAVGATVGAALPAAARGAQAVARRGASGTSEAASRVARTVGSKPREAKVTPAATRKAEEVVQDIARRQGVVPEQLAADPALVAGKPITGAELLGSEAQTQLTAIGRRSGQTGDVLAETITARQEGAPARIVEDFSQASGLDAATVADDFTLLSAMLRSKAGPLYEEAYAAGPVDSPNLRELLKRPSVQQAIKRAYGLAAEEGRDPAQIGFVRQEKAPLGFGGEPTERAVAVSQTPTAQTWDYVKRGMDDVLESYRDPTTRQLNLDTEGRAIVGTQTQLRDELTALNPKYGEALKAGGEPLRLESAFRDAKKLFSNNVPERVFLKRWEAVSPSEKQGMIAGLGNDLFERARAGRLRPREFKSPAFKAKIRTALGPKADSFLAALEQEARLAQGNRMAPGTNSVTAEILEANRQMDGRTGFAGDLALRLDRGQGPAGAVAGATMNALMSPVAGFVRGVQAPYSQAVRDEVGRILLDPEETLNVIRRMRETQQNALSPWLVGPAASASAQ